MELDLRRYWRVARRWWWFFILAPLLAGSVSFFVSNQEQPLYRATATVLVNPGEQTNASDYNAIHASQRLAETYRRLIVTTPVLERVTTKLQLPFGSYDLQNRVTSQAIEDTQLVEVSVVDEDPARAALLANTVATEFQDYVAELAIEQMTQTSSGITQQISEKETQIADLDQQINELDTNGNSDDTAVQAQIERLRNGRSQLQQELATLQLSAQSLNLNVAAAQTQVRVAEPAAVPQSPFAPRTSFYTMLGAFVGLLIAIGTIALLEYLDNSVKPSSDFMELTGAPLLASVGRVEKLRSGPHQVFVVEHPRSPASEAMRLLRANLDFTAAAQPLTTIVVSSSGPGEGKSTITANLAVVMAQTGLATVIIDADLRRPSQHHIFGVRNDIGLTNLLTHSDQPWTWAATGVAVPRLRLLPSGPLPPNPADLFSLERWSRLLEEISGDADVVLIDTPPILAVSDPLVIAKKTDGVLLVSRSGHTRPETLRQAAAHFRQGAMRLVGIVLNQQTGRGGEGYYYYSSYYGETESARSQLSPNGSSVLSPRQGHEIEVR